MKKLSITKYGAVVGTAVLLLIASLALTSCPPPFESELAKAARETVEDAQEGAGGSAATPGIKVNPTTGLFTSESGQTTKFEVVLNSEPAAAVSIPIQTTDNGEGTVDQIELVFDPATWSTVKVVTITGVDDMVIDGDQHYVIELASVVSDDTDYNGMDPQDVTVTNTDNDAAAIVVDPVDGLQTTEYGTQAEFTIVLSTEPEHPVTIPVSSSDSGEGVPSANEAVFTAADWSTPKTITVSGVEDALQDGNQNYTILIGVAESNDGNYNGFDADDVACINVDNDTAGITVNPISGLVTTEGGGSDTFQTVLNSQPESDVVISFSSDTPAEGFVSPSSAIFTTDNWSNPKTITVTGVDDDVDDGDQNYIVSAGPASSSDNDYNGMAVDNVSATNEDDDTAGFTLSQTNGLTVYEDPGHANNTDTFTVRLNSKPTANVSFNISSSDTTEATISPLSMTFTAANWSSNQSVTVTGEDDAANDGSRNFTIVLASAVSSDPNYSGMNAPNVSGTNYGETRKVATPSISKSGIYYTPQTVTMGCSTNGATIRYEIGTNPSNPTESSPAYSGEIEVNEPLTVIKVRGFYSDWTDSNVNTKTIEIPFLKTVVANNIVSNGASLLVVGPNNDYIYVGDQANNRIRKFTVNGSLVSGDDINLGADARDIFWWKSNAVFVSTENWVKAYDPDTQVLLKTYNENISDASGIAVDDELFVHDHHSSPDPFWLGVGVYDIEGANQVKSWWTSGDAYPDMDIHPVIDGGTLYLTDGGSSAGNINVYDYTGNKTDEWTVSSATCTYIAAYTFEPIIGSDEYYVLIGTVTGGKHFVKRYDTTGTLVDEFEVPDEIKGLDAAYCGELGSHEPIYVLTSGEDLLKYVKN